MRSKPTSEAASQPPRGTSRRPPKPIETVEIFGCSYCGASALGGPDEVFHLNKRCPGKADVSIVMRVTMRPESIEPCG